MDHFRYAISTALAVFACGCMVDPSAEETTPAPDEAVEATADALNASKLFTWKSGDSAKPMGTTTKRVCFLTMVGGELNGSDRQVRVFALGGSWYLGGSAAGSLSAAARCVASDAYTAEVSWTSGQAYPKQLESKTHYSCFLTRINGDLRKGSDVRVYKDASHANWLLSGTTASTSTGVTAGARCTKTEALAAPYAWQSGNPRTPMGTSSGRACALIHAGGDFDAGALVETNINAAGNWYLGGSAVSASSLGTRAHAVCF